MAFAPNSSAYPGSTSDPFQIISQHAAPAFFPPSAFPPTAQAAPAVQLHPTPHVADASTTAVLLAGLQHLHTALAHQEQQNAQLRLQLEISAIRDQVKTQTIGELQEQLHQAKQVVQNGAIDRGSKFVPTKCTGDSDSTAKCVICMYSPFPLCCNVF
jgi:hypothetical protein